MGWRSRSLTGGLAGALGVAAAMAIGAGAAETTINFDDLAAGASVTTQYQSRGIVFGPVPGGSESAPKVTADGTKASSQPNTARLSGTCNPVTADPATSIQKAGGQFTDPQETVKMMVGTVAPSPTDWTLTVYDANGAQLGQSAVVAPANGGAHTPLSVTVAGGGIVYFRVTGEGCYFAPSPAAIDDVAFTPPPPATTTTGTTPTSTEPGRTPPRADVASRVPPRAGVQVPLDGSASTGDGLRYRWVFGDGTPPAARAAVATAGANTAYVVHTFPAPGDFPVTLEVTDSAGQTTSTTKTVHVSPTPSGAVKSAKGYVRPRKKFKLTMPTDLSGAKAGFYAWSFDDTPKTFKGKLGSNVVIPGVQPSKGPSTTHTFRRAGRHRVLGQVLDSGGAVTSVATEIHVGSVGEQLDAAGKGPGAKNVPVAKKLGAAFTYTDTPATKIPVVFKDVTPDKTIDLFNIDQFGDPHKAGTVSVHNVGWKFCKTCKEEKLGPGQGFERAHTFDTAGDYDVTLKVYGHNDLLVDQVTTTVHVLDSKCDALNMNGIPSIGECRTPIRIGDVTEGWRTQPGAAETVGGMRLYNSGDSIDLYEKTGVVMPSPGANPIYASVAGVTVATTTGFTVPGLTANDQDGEAAKAAQLIDFVHPPSSGSGAPAMIHGLKVVGGDVRLFPSSPARVTALLALKPPFEGTVPAVFGGAGSADDAADISVQAPDIALGPVQVQNLRFAHYGPGHADSHGKEAGWYGGADVSVSDLLSIKAADEPARVPPTGVALKETGDFKYVGAALDLTSSPLPIGSFGGIYQLGMFVQVPGGGQAFIVSGGVELGIPYSPAVVKVLNGCVGLGIYKPGDKGTLCDLKDYVSPTDNTIFRVSGDVGVEPIGVLGHGYAQFQTYGSKLEFAADMNDYDVLGLGLLIVSGHAGGFIGFQPFQFQVDASSSICVADIACEGGAFLISSKGVAGCLDLYVGHAGAAYVYGGKFSLFGEFASDCDIKAESGVSIARHATPDARELLLGRTSALPPQNVKLKADLPFAVIGVTGQDGPPQVVLKGPKGETITDTGAPLQRTKTYAIAHSAKLKKTWAFIKKPSAGTWNIAPKAGSPGIEKLYQRDGLPPPHIQAKVIRAGAGYLFNYRVNPEAGQVVTFAEEGPNVGSLITSGKAGTARVVARASAPGGRVRFRPKSGPGGRRNIVALVTQNGVPRGKYVVGHYTAPRPPKVGKPRLRKKLRGTTLTISWPKTAAAARYRIQVRASDGRLLTRTTKASQRALVLRHFLRTTSAVATVTPLAADGRRGKAGVLKVKRRGRAPALVL